MDRDGKDIMIASGNSGDFSDRRGSTESLRFWEIEVYFKCPVIGQCLTIGDQKRILKKTGYSPVRLNSFEMHQLFVASGENENRLSQRVDYCLAQKYGSRAACLYRLPEQAFMQQWRLAFEAGDYDGALWVAATRKNLSEKARTEVFGAVHMSMHNTATNLASQRRQSQRLEEELSRAAEKNRGLITGHTEFRKEHDEMRRVIDRLKHDLAESERQHRLVLDRLEMSETVERLEETVAENQRLKAQITDQASQILVKEQRINDMRLDTQRLVAELEDERQSFARFRHEAQETLQQFLRASRCDVSCPAFDLCSKRVLIVGGITRMESLYRKLIEESGGIFDYHDGYMNGGTRQLEVSLKRADIVLCPVNCNSHAACSLVKNLGKKHNKPVHMLPNISLSALSNALSGGRKAELTKDCTPHISS